MIRALQSPRRRRRLTKLGTALLVVGLLVFVGIRYANTGDKLAGTRPGAPQGPVTVPRTVHRTAKSIDQVRAVADQFIQTAVYRHHLDAAWELTAPSLRTGVTHKDWMTGNIPVVPYPQEDVDLVKWTLDYSFPRRVGMKVALVAKPGSPTTGLIAHMELQDIGQGDTHRWAVDSWVPMGGGQALRRAISPLDSDQGPTKAKLGATWIFLPIGLIVGLVLLIPLGLGVRGWMRHKHAMRAYSSSSRPS